VYQIIIGSIERSAKCQCLSYSEGNFEVFRPAGMPNIFLRVYELFF